MLKIFSYSFYEIFLLNSIYISLYFKKYYFKFGHNLTKLCLNNIILLTFMIENSDMKNITIIKRCLITRVVVGLRPKGPSVRRPLGLIIDVGPPFI